MRPRRIPRRDWYNPGADLKRWFDYYAEFTGTPIDRPRLRYYYVKAMIITPLSLAGIVQNMTPALDRAEWYAQDVSYQRGLVEALAEAIGIELVQSDSLSASQEEALLRYFHRHAVREEQLMHGALGAGEHSTRQPIG